MNEGYFNTGSVELHFVEGPPAGPPLLLLHPLFSMWRDFSVLTPGLEKIAHVLALDLRGHGLSGRAASYRIEDFVPDQAAFIRGQIGKPAVVFGHSLGGMIALMLGAAHPELVRALIIGEAIISRKLLEEFSAASRPMITWWREVAKLKSPELIVEELRNELVSAPGKKERVPARQLLGDNNPAFKFFAECLSLLDSAVLTANIERWEETYAAYRPEELFPKVRCPVLLLQGRRELGGLMPDRDVEKAMGLLPNGRRVRIEKAGHYLHLEDRDGVLRAVTEFLEDLKPAGEGA
jgi:pimeloyl-ACP methyl ester carboxylesterase